MTSDKLRALLCQHLTAPLDDVAFLRELQQLTNTRPHELDETFEVSSELDRILSNFYTQQIHADLILRIRPEFACMTIDPNSTVIRDVDTQHPGVEAFNVTHTQLTLGSANSRPSQLERLGEQSIYYSPSVLGDTFDLGDAWVASDDLLERQILLRELEYDSSTGDDAVNHFVREAQIAGQLEHPNILPVYSLAWSSDNLPYYTMKFVDGRSFQQHIELFHESNTVLNRGTLRESLDILLAICNAISYAHSRGVYHGQLSSTAISLGEFGEVMVLNWSNAIVSPPGSDCLQMMNDDRQAIARLLYELLTGTPSSQSNSNPIPVLPSQVPNPLRSILLESSSEDTCYNSVAELANDLRAYLADQPLKAHKDTYRESALRWSRTHPLYILFATAALFLVTFTLLTETFILRHANDQAQASLAATRQLTSHLIIDNNQIRQEQQAQDDATSTSEAALETANIQLLAAERSEQLALDARNTARALETESKALEFDAQADYKLALTQEAIAVDLLAQAKTDEVAANQSAIRIRDESISSLQKQITTNILHGRGDLAMRNAKLLFPFLTNAPDTPIQSLKGLASFSYIRTSQHQTGLTLQPVTIMARPNVTGGPITITQFQPTQNTTQLHFLDPTRHHTHELPGQIQHYFHTSDGVVTISNNDHDATIAIINNEQVTYGRLSDVCHTAVLVGDTLYAGLRNGHVVTFSISELTQSPPITILPSRPQRMAVSANGNLLACNFASTLQIFNLKTAKLEYTFALPSACEQLWFPSSQSVAVLTDKFYVNEFYLDESKTRKIRFRPSPHDNQLVDYIRYADKHFMLFAKGTIVRLSKQLSPKTRQLDDAIKSRFLHIDQQSVLIRNRRGMLLTLDTSTLLSDGIPIMLKSPIVAAIRSDSAITLATADGVVGVYEQPANSFGQQIRLPNSVRHVEFTFNGDTLIQIGSNQLARVLEAGDSKIIYKHPRAISGFRTVGNGNYLIVNDDAQFTILRINDGGILGNPLILPLDVRLNTFTYQSDPDTFLLASPSTLYHCSDEQIYTYAHPINLDGALSITLSDDGQQALLSSSNITSKVYVVSLDTLAYNKQYSIDGFIRNVFWSSSRNRFLLITTLQDVYDHHQLIDLDASGISNRNLLEFPMNHAIFNPDSEELIIGTIDNRVVRYSTITHQPDMTMQMQARIKYLHLNDQHTHILLTTPASTVVLDYKTLRPLTPLINGVYLRPTIMKNALHSLKRTATGLTISDIETLLGSRISSDQIRTCYEQ